MVIITYKTTTKTYSGSYRYYQATVNTAWKTQCFDGQIGHPDSNYVFTMQTSQITTPDQPNVHWIWRESDHRKLFINTLPQDHSYGPFSVLDWEDVWYPDNTTRDMLKAIEYAHNRTRLHMCVFITKWISNTLPTGVVMQEFRQQRVFNRCPWCNYWGEDRNTF